MEIEKLVIKTGTQCSLRCEKCGEFNPYMAQKGKRFSLSAKTLAGDICKISQAVDKISCIHIAGGEPFLHGDLFLLLSYLYTIDNIEKIEVVTNGTVLPNAITLKTLFSLKSKLVVLVSDYSVSGVDNNAVIQALRDGQIRHSVFRDMTWKDKTNAQYRPLDAAQLRYIADNCQTYRKNPYFSVVNGIVTAHCPTAGSILYYHDLSEKDRDASFELRRTPNNKVLPELERLHAIETLPMCKYCVPSYEAEDCPAGEQLVQ